MAINFDLLTLKAFLLENAEFLTSARLQKIQQPTRAEFLFTLRNSGETRKLYVNIHPNFYHLCFMSKEMEEKRMIEIPKSPPMFCMLLRKYLEGARVAKVLMPENERILEFYFEVQNELSEKIYLCLAVELMGKHSNVVLYNYDTNVIIGCAHNVGAEKSRHREMIGGLPYVYPPKQDKKDILAVSFEEFFNLVGWAFQPNKVQKDSYKALSDIFFGVSQVFAKQICSKYQSPKELFNRLQDCLELKNIFPAISLDFSEFSLWEEFLEGAVLTKNVNDMIDKYFAHHQHEEKFKAIKTKLLLTVNSKSKKANNSVFKLKKQISSMDKADFYRKRGDLIMANLYANKDFAKFIEVFDYENNSNLKIDLDETKTLKENANKYYKLYNKAKTTNSKSNELLEGLSREKEYLEQILYSIENADCMNALLEIQDEISSNGQKTNKSCHAEFTAPLVFKQSENYKGGCRKRRSASIQSTNNGKILKRVQDDTRRGKTSSPLILNHAPFTIYIGKNNKQNDYIISKLSRDEDLWFHVHNCAGSHVLLRVEKGQEPDEKTIFECAKLAKEYSSAKNSSKVGVIYTKRKFLKKPPGANLGYVIYKNEKEIVVD